MCYTRCTCILKTKNAETEFGRAKQIYIYIHVISANCVSPCVLISSKEKRGLRSSLHFVLHRMCCAVGSSMRLAFFLEKKEPHTQNIISVANFALLSYWIKKPISYWNLSIRLNHTDQRNRFIFPFLLLLLVLLLSQTKIP